MATDSAIVSQNQVAEVVIGVLSNTEKIPCPSRNQKNQFGSCEVCWDENIENVVYELQ